MTEPDDEGTADALRSIPDKPAPDALRASLREDLARELAAARAADGLRNTDDQDTVGSTVDESGELATVIELDARGDQHRAPTMARLGWVALVVMLTASAALIARVVTDSTEPDASQTSAASPTDPVAAAEAACDRFVDATSVEGATFEVLVSNGRQLWTELGVDPAVHLAEVHRATDELVADLGDAGFLGDDESIIAGAVGHLEELSTLTSAAAEGGSEAALEIIVRLRDPLVAAEQTLASLGVAGCT